MILFYVLTFILILILIVFAYIRIQFPFWAIQPIFHIYDISYYLFPPGIIRIELPEKEDKYNNFQEIKTFSLDKLSKNDKVSFEIFIREHFLHNKEIHYAPKDDNIWAYMEGLEGGPTFVSFYKKDCLSTISPLEQQIIGTMVSYPLQVIIYNGKPDAFFNAYYVDYLCVHSDYRNKNIAPQIIQTHHYHQRHRNQNIQVSIFKREGKLNAAVPLCFYTVSGYPIQQIISLNNLQLHPSIHAIEMSHKNLSLFVDFMKKNETNYDISISPSLSNVARLIQTENVYVYLLIEDGNVFSAHFFKKQCSYIEKEKEILNCIASIISTNVSMDIILLGYIQILNQIIKKYPSYSILLIENKSDNVLLNKKLSLSIRSLYNIPCAYYFYNFAYPSFKPEKSLILI